MKKIIILLLPLLLTTGCYNYRELNELAIVTAIEVDKIDNEYQLLFQIANPKNQNDASSSNQSKFVTYETKGTTIAEAFENIIKKSSRKIYGMHIQLLIITENIAKEDLQSMLDFFFRNVEIRKEFYVVLDTSKNDNKVLKLLTPITNLSSKNILDTLETSNKYLGITNLVTFNDLMDIYLDDNKELVLPTVTTTGNSKEGQEENNLETTSTYTNVELGNMAIFKNEKLLGYLTPKQSITVNILKNETHDTLITYKCNNNDNKFIAEEVTIENTDINIDTDKLQVTITLKGKAHIEEYSCNDDLKDENVIKNIETNLNKYIEENIKNNILEINKTYNSDIYNFKDIIYKQNPSFFKKIKDNYYEEIFNKLTYKVNSNIKLQGKGNVLGSTYN